VGKTILWLMSLVVVSVAIASGHRWWRQQQAEQALAVVLVGLSFGSVVGLEMARMRPDLFLAYVGTGLFVHRDEGRVIAYRRTVAAARAQLLRLRNCAPQSIRHIAERRAYRGRLRPRELSRGTQRARLADRGLGGALIARSPPLYVVVLTRAARITSVAVPCSSLSSSSNR
jgi:pimeloyl-ACP methyl ester carboxylesterase